MPTPSSAIAISTASSWRAVRSRIVPAPSIACAAFTIRFRKTRSSSRRRRLDRPDVAELALDADPFAQMRRRDAQRALEQLVRIAALAQLAAAAREDAHVAHDRRGALDAFERVVEHRGAFVEDLRHVPLRRVGAPRLGEPLQCSRSARRFAPM